MTLLKTNAKETTVVPEEGRGKGASNTLLCAVGLLSSSLGTFQGIGVPIGVSFARLSFYVADVEGVADAAGVAVLLVPQLC